MNFRFPRRFWPALLGLILTGLLLAGCGESGATGTTGSTPGTTGQPAGPDPTPTLNLVPTPGSPGPGMAGIPEISPKQSSARPFTANWKINLDEGTEPQVVGEMDGLIFVKSHQGGLYAFDQKTGTLAWKMVPKVDTSKLLPGPGPLTLLYPGTVAFGDVTAETFSAYDTKTGKKKWDFNLKFDAPNRDPGSRFLGGRVYGQTAVVAVSSKQDPYNKQVQNNNPEYVLLVGIDLDSGKKVWSAITDPPDRQVGARIASVIFGSKQVIVESPDLTAGALDGEKGTRLWRALNLFLVRTDNPDLVYSVVAENGTAHNPRLRKINPENGKLIWEKVLGVQVQNDPPIAISPDEKSAYVVVVVSSKESYVYMVDLESNEPAWRFNSQTYGTFSLTATNDGVRLRNYGKNSGVVFLNRENPSPVSWAVGGVELVDDVAASEGLYLTARYEQGGLLYLVDLETGDIKLAAKTAVPGQEPVLGSGQVYLVGAGPDGKPVLAAYARPQG